MNFKKRVNGSWHDTPHYIHNTATDTITTLPAVLHPTDTTATVGLKGNMYQASGVSPTTPIQPQETGERTGNLCSNIAYKTNYYINAQGVETSINGFNIYSISCNPNTNYTISLKSPLGGTTVRVHTYDKGVWIEQTAYISIQDFPSTFTTPNNADEIRISIANTANGNIMLNTGSTALPYEPYGIKIPILSNSTTTNVYLGEVESTRRIKKLVFDGTEDFQRVSISGNLAVFVYTLSEPAYQSNSADVISTHYVGSTSPTAGNVYIASSTTRLGMVDEFSSKSVFQSYLQQQYDAGTPVTVWYVLATPETATINEPLMKIGDYADEVANISIPVTAGANTLSVGTTLQPSEVSVNYKGWHPVSDAHERENGQWD